MTGDNVDLKWPTEVKFNFLIYSFPTFWRKVSHYKKVEHKENMSLRCEHPEKKNSILYFATLHITIKRMLPL